MKEYMLDLSDKVINKALKVGFEEVALIIGSRKEVMVKIANSEPSVIQRWNNINLGLYLSKEKKILTVSLQPTHIEEVYKTIEDIYNIVPKIKESKIYAPLPESSEVKPLKGTVDKSIIDTMENPSDIAERIINIAHKNSIDFVAGMLDLSYNEKLVATSKGTKLYEDFTAVESYLRAFAGNGSGQWAYGSRKLDVKKLEKMAEIASNYASESRKPETIEPGVYDIIFSPMIAGNLFNLVTSMSSAFSVFMGTSIFMRNKPGDKVASENLTIIDNPRDSNMIGSTAFDDEGLSTYNKAVIENGVLKTLLHNTKTASKMNTKSTGNAGWMYPHPWNMKITSGDYSLDELISEVKRGLLITNNWYTRLQNYVEGIFSTIARDAMFLIENGRIVKPVSKLRVTDKLPSLLKNVQALGKEVFDIKWWEVEIPSSLPYVLVKNVRTSKHRV